MKYGKGLEMKILLAVDGSDCSTRATAQVVALAAELRVAPEIHLLHVHPPIPIGRVQHHVGHDSLERYYREESLPHLVVAEEMLNAAGLAHTRHIHVGVAADVVIHVATQTDCNLIVIGSHGRSALAEAVLGSVSHRVLHLAPCPVLVVK